MKEMHVGIDLEKAYFIQPEEKKKLRRTAFYYVFFPFLVGFILVLEIIFSSSIQKVDSRVIHGLQSLFSDGMHKNSFFQVLTDILHYYTHFNILNCALCLIYCSFHPFISFKIGMLFNMTIFAHSVVTLLVYREPKPYWESSDIKTYECEAIFTGPAYNQLMATIAVFYTMTISSRYQVFSGKLTSTALVIVFIVLNIMTLFTSILNAEHFIYQHVVGIIIAAIIVLVTNIFDRSLSIWIIKLSFAVKSSKKNKFIFMVALLLIFGAVLAFTSAIAEQNLFPPAWIQNYHGACPDAQHDIVNAFENTKLHLASSTFIIGMVFGSALSNETLALYWWDSSFLHRIIRGCMAVATYAFVFIPLRLIPGEDFETRFFFHYILPNAIASFACYGLLPLAFNALKIVKQPDREEEQHSLN